MSEIVAVIPGKGESIRLPRKNLKPFGGRPLIAHTIGQAVASAEVSKVYVSTDSEEIAELARGLGAEVPFLRPAALALPHVHSLEPIMHLLEKVGAADRYGYAMMLLPTCPLRRVDQIDAIARLARERESNVLSVVDLGKTVFHLRTIDAETRIVPVVDFQPNFQHGDSPHVYAINGSCYCGPLRELLRNRTFHGGLPFGYVMDEITGMDIDTLEQFELAERLYAFGAHLQRVPGGNA